MQTQLASHLLRCSDGVPLVATCALFHFIVGHPPLAHPHLLHDDNGDTNSHQTQSHIHAPTLSDSSSSGGVTPSIGASRLATPPPRVPAPATNASSAGGPTSTGVNRRLSTHQNSITSGGSGGGGVGLPRMNMAQLSHQAQASAAYKPSLPPQVELPWKQ